MKERPILFSGPMVRAILAGEKSETRRILKPQPTPDPTGECVWIEKGQRLTWETMIGGAKMTTIQDYTCPYGQPGDRLWVRETWMPFGVVHWGVEVGSKATNDIRPDGTDPYTFGAAKRFEADDARRDAWTLDIERMDVLGERWRPSIHMPRWASRITLEVTGVRVERLQEITEEGAKAEGISDAYLVKNHLSSDRVLAYRYLWEDINGRGSWDANPWVWVIQFPRVDK